jgi:hypothetical protein
MAASRKLTKPACLFKTGLSTLNIHINNLPVLPPALPLAITLFAVVTGASLVFFGEKLSATLLLVGFGGLATILDYRVGNWLLVFLMAFSSTILIPRQVFGLVGLNPMNVLLAVTLLSVVVRRILKRESIQFVRPPNIMLCYLVLIVFAAALGSFHAHQSVPLANSQGTYETMTKAKYLLENFFKPMVILLVAWLLAVQAGNGGGRSLIWAVAVAAFVFCSIVITYIVASGTGLEALASSRARGFLSWTGMHANELGLLSNITFALLLYTGLGMPKGGGRLAFIACAAATALTAVCTFSRGAFLGVLVVGAYYLVSRRRFRQLAASFAVLAAVAAFLPSAFVDRATTGLQKGDSSAITAGRLDGIWLPLWPTVWERPVLGHGLSSTLWAEPNIRGTMLPVGHPHSAYLGVLLDFGLVGAVVVTLVFRSMWKLFRELFTHHPDPFWQGVFEGGSVCMLVLLAQGMTGDRFVPTYAQASLWLAYGLAIGHRHWSLNIEKMPV